MGRKGCPPKWQVQVEKNVQRIKKRSTSRFLKSCDVYECICIFISDHLKKNVFSHGTIGLYFRHLQRFSRWLHESKHISDIRRLDTSCLRKYFSYLDRERNYRKSSLEGVQTSLVRFFRSMKYRRLIEANPCKDFHISARRDPTNVYILTPFDLMAVLRSVKSHYQYLRLQKRFKPSFLFIHRRDLCILALCIACGLRRGEIQKIQIEDVDFNAKTILIHGKGNQRFIVKERMAFFSHPFLDQMIRRYYELRKTLPGENFFCNCLGEELGPSTINYVFEKYLSFYSKGVPCNPTITRKSFASQLVYKKVNIEAIRALLGHTRSETTLRYYVHFSASKLEKTWKETNPYANTDSL